jgi:hypothetical protein
MLCDLAPLVAKKRAPRPEDPPHRPRTYTPYWVRIVGQIYNVLGRTVAANFQYISRRGRILQYAGRTGLRWPIAVIFAAADFPMRGL